MIKLDAGTHVAQSTEAGWLLRNKRGRTANADVFPDLDSLASALVRRALIPLDDAQRGERTRRAAEAHALRFRLPLTQGKVIAFGGDHASVKVGTFIGVSVTRAGETGTVMVAPAVTMLPDFLHVALFYPVVNAFRHQYRTLPYTDVDDELFNLAREMWADLRAISPE